VKSINRNNAEAPSIFDLSTILMTNSAKQTFDHATTPRSKAAAAPRVLMNSAHGFLLENATNAKARLWGGSSRASHNWQLALKAISE
jgi:hypothetical protein